MRNSSCWPQPMRFASAGLSTSGFPFGSCRFCAFRRCYYCPGTRRPRKPDGDNWEKGPLSLISIPISARILAAASLPIPGTRTDQFHRLGVRRQFLPNLLVEFFDHLFNKLHMFQRLSDEQAMMIAHAVSFQRFHNLRDFQPQRSSSQIGHLFWD